MVVLLAEGFEDLEFWVTVMRLREEGAEVTVAGSAMLAWWDLGRHRGWQAATGSLGVKDDLVNAGANSWPPSRKVRTIPSGISAPTHSSASDMPPGSPGRC